jgi:hypothetical protein
MANTNPGGIDLNISPYFDDYDEDKKFVRVLYNPGRAVQARELTQMQTLQQVQIRRFADYFFKQGALVEGCEQILDLNMDYVKLQDDYDGNEVDVSEFENQIIFGANTGIKAYCGIVESGFEDDPKTLFINYLSTGSILLTVNNAATTLTPGNTLTLSTGNTAKIEASYIDPITGTNKILVSNPIGTLTTTTANTVNDVGTTIYLNITAIDDKRSNTTFEENETIFTSNVNVRAYASAFPTNATKTIVDEGQATEITYTKGSKITIKEGIIYLADHFVKHDTQTIILDKYTNKPSYKVGIVPSRMFIDYIDDPTLVDNAQGTPNFQAPGADRFKIETNVVKYALDDTISENEFITLVEIEEGITRKRKAITIENKLEESIAQRTAEESGDYTLTDPNVFVREHLLQNTNGGRYTLSEGGNNSLLLVEVDPFTSYVSGLRNQKIVKKEVELRKGLDTEFVEQIKTQINYGEYIEVNELVGSWDFMESTKVDLYDTAQQVITNGTYSSAIVTGSKIGEARVRAIQYVSGVQGTASARYFMYLYEVTMNSGQSFENVRSIYQVAGPVRYADIILDTFGRAVLQETSFNSLVFKLPYSAIKTIRDESENVESQFRFRKKFSISFSAGLATISTTDSSERFVGTGILNDFQKNEFYMVVISNSGVDVETGNLSGTVTVTAGTKVVTGSGTAFTNELNVGDTIKIGSQSVKIASIASATSLTLVANHTAGATGATFRKILPAGSLVSLSSLGGTGGSRIVNVNSAGTITIDIKENATFTAEVIATMDRTNARERKKLLIVDQTTNINPNTHPTGLTGPYGLGYSDIYRIKGIYQSSDFSTPATTANTNVTTSYILDDGQRDYAYEHATITPNFGVTPSGRLLVVFDYFNHDTTQGLAYTSVDSYPIDDVTTANNTITTANIPVFTSPKTGQIYNLRDCIDFRPVKSANTSINPINNLGYQIPSGGLHIPYPNSDFDADLIFYKGRIVKLYINSRGAFGINEGVSGGIGSQSFQVPPKLPDTLELAEFVVPPYPSLPQSLRIKLLKNRRFTMKDIGKLNDRVEKLEYYTTLSFLEKQATDKTEIDSDGFDRFKNGILVDPFTGYSIANPLNNDYSAAIDKKQKYLTCKQDNANTIRLEYDSSTSGTTIRNGNKIMLPFTEEINPGLYQPYASRQLRLAEELNFIWTGELKIYPFVDNWVETTNDPSKEIVYDDTGDADNWKALVDAWNAEVSPLTTHWVGDIQTNLVGGTSITTREASGNGTYDITTQVQRTTESAFNQLVSITQAPKQTVTGDRVIDVTAALWMRSRDFIIHATGLKNNSRLYAFFDSIAVTQHCKQIKLTGTKTLSQIINQNYDENDFLTGENVDWTVVADGSTQALRVAENQIYLLFRVPVRSFYVGQREFKLTDSPTNSEGTTLTSARNNIYAQGVSQVKSAITINTRPFDVSFTDANNVRSLGRLITDERRVEVTRAFVPPPPPPRNWDPVAQSFFVDSETYPQGFYITSIDLFFRTKSQDDNRNVYVEIREMVNGYPAKQVIGIGDEAIVNNRDIKVSEDASEATTFTFKNPIYLGPGNEYCFTIKPENNDPDFAVWVAELGAIDITNTESDNRIDGAYNTGILFTSANDRTWTARQNTDIKFTARVAKFDTTAKFAFWNNIPITNAFQYDSFYPIIGDQQLPGTTITYEIKTADSSFIVDGEYTAIKNYERLDYNTRKQISSYVDENAGAFKSLQLRATLSTIDPYITPYIDNENIRFAFSKNIINNQVSESIPGTVEYSNGSNIIIGTGTDFSNTVYVGEFINCGDQFRRVQSISNNTFMTVSTNFTASNGVNQIITSRNEENPNGPYSSETRYITRTVTLKDGFEATDLVVYIDVNRPPGTSVKVYCKLLNENDTDRFDDKFYLPMTLQGTEIFTLDQNQYIEEKYVIPAIAKTGGAELLAGTVSVSNSTNQVFGTSTRFIQDLKIGDILGVGVARIEKVITSIANNEYLTVESAFPITASGESAFRVLNNEVSYTTPDGRIFNGYKYFAIKIVMTSSNPNYAPKVKDLRGIALS